MKAALDELVSAHAAVAAPSAEPRSVLEPLNEGGNGIAAGGGAARKGAAAGSEADVDRAAAGRGVEPLYNLLFDGERLRRMDLAGCVQGGSCGSCGLI